MNNTNCTFRATLEVIDVSTPLTCTTFIAVIGPVTINPGTTTFTDFLIDGLGYSSPYSWMAGDTKVSRFKITYGFVSCTGGNDVGIACSPNGAGPVTITACNTCNGGVAPSVLETTCGGLQCFTIN